MFESYDALLVVVGLAVLATGAFFGIRGIGSFYYLAFALNEADFPGEDALWSLVGFVVLLSIVVHGVLGGPVMRLLDVRRDGRRG